MNIGLTSFTPANCGYEVAWPVDFLARCEGRPLKNISASADGMTIAGELLITRYGLEGGTLYQLGPVLREMKHPRLTIDLKPTFTIEQVRAKLETLAKLTPLAAARICRLSPTATALMDTYSGSATIESLANLVKVFPIELIGPRPLEEAISTAGGVAWNNLDRNLMLRHQPGLFCAGEMIDWEAPTGGYLLQGCLATGTRAGRGAIQFLQSNQTG